MNKSQRGFALIEGLLIILILVFLGFAGYYVWHTQKNTDKSSKNALSASQNTTSSSETAFYNCVKHSNGGTPVGARLDDSLKTLTCQYVNGYTYSPKYTHSALAPVKTVSQQSSTLSDWHSAPDNLKNAITSLAPAGACTSSKSVTIAGDFAVFDYGCDGGDKKLFMMNSGQWKLMSDWINNFSCDLVQKNQIPIVLTQYQDENSKVVAKCVDNNNIEHQVAT